MTEQKSSPLYSYIFFYALSLFTIAGFVWAIFMPKDFEYVQAFFQKTILPLGWFAPVVFVLLQALQVVVTPISHYAIGVLGGFLYGPFYGGILNWLGRILGHVTAFSLSKQFGRPLVEKYVQPAMLNKFDRYLAGKNVNGFNNQSMILFLIYFLPLFPDDEISYVVGLTPMRYRTFVVCNILGHLGGAFSLSYLGSGKVSGSDPLFWVLLLSTLGGALAMFFLTKRAQGLSRPPVDSSLS